MIVAMANWALVILTLGLLIATAIYVFHTKRSAKDTKRMADVAEKEHELRVKAKLDFDVGGRMTSTEGIDVQFKFFNAGEFSLKLKLIVFT